jgi:hypothetical protein
MELKALQTDRKRIVQLPVNKENGEVGLVGLAIWHRPVTPLLDDQLAEIAQAVQADAVIADDSPEQPEQKAKRKHVLVAQLAVLLTRWDITDQGQPVPITEGALASLEYEALAAMRDAIYEPIYPKKAT